MHFPEIPWWAWIILLFLVVGIVSQIEVAGKKGWLFVQSRDVQALTAEMGAIREAIPGTLSDELVTRVIAGVPSALADHVTKLTAERNRLLAERESQDWVMLSVILHGLEAKDKTVGPCRALVEVNRRTGKLRPPPESHRFYTDAGNEWWARYRVPFKVPRLMDLGAPEWRKTANEPLPPIYMLGVVYHYKA